MALSAPALAQGTPPTGAAIAAVERFHAALLAVMQDAPRLGARGRFDRLVPVMTRTFDLAAMTRIASGGSWVGFTGTDQTALVDAFTRWSIATYAARFDGYSGETFVTNGTQALANGDILVRTTLTRSGNQEPVALSYLLRGNPPRIVDVYLTGTISELASRRSEFITLTRQGGAARVLEELQTRADRLLAG
ncbi:MAG: hopanoid biosynthesis protein HpnM [Rubritepida sp.]|nr:hopanoid biosynthesis protein HpnM [Rubritepida sp.]